MIPKVVTVVVLAAGFGGCATQQDAPESARLQQKAEAEQVAAPNQVPAAQIGFTPSSQSNPLAQYENLSQKNNPGRAASLPYYDQRAFVLTQNMEFRLVDGESLVVPAGFVTDYASIPQYLWSIYSPHDVYSRAAVVHDYLYWTQQCTKEQADNLFLIAMKESSVGSYTRTIVYEGVVKAGRSSWCENKNARVKGLPRTLEGKYWTAPAGVSWSKFQRQLFDAGLRDPSAVNYSAICRYGDGTSLPATPPKIQTMPPIDTTKC